MLIKIALATPGYPSSLQDGLGWVERLTKEAATAGAAIICFPESYLPGYPADGYERESCMPEQLQAALQTISSIARESAIAVIIPMDWYDGDSLLNVAHVVSGSGEVLGYQAKVQMDPTEDTIWKAGEQRRIFEINGLRFGIAICHEGFRYPETVRWAARQGAHIVFHPNFTGSHTGGRKQEQWGSSDSPYYEKAQMMRAIENTIYFAPSNYAFPYPESASAVIDPGGRCIAWHPYGEPGVTVAEIDTNEATGLLARRFRPGGCGYTAS